MTDVTIPDIVLRTTSDGEAFAHGLALATGGSVDEAVTGLMDEARRQAEEYELGRITDRRHARVGGRGLPVTGLDDPGGEPERWYEVVDVRLAGGPPGADPTERWVAYGTLRSTRTRPGSGGYWSADSVD